MNPTADIPWQDINAFLLACGDVHDPYKYCVTVLDDFGQLVAFDEGMFLMLDGNRRIVRKYFKNISRRWSSVYLEYYSKVSDYEYGLNSDVSENRSKPFVMLIDWEDHYGDDDDFMSDYIRARGLRESLTFTLFDLNGAPATAFSLDCTKGKRFTEHDLEIMNVVVPHLNNLYKNMFVRPSGQVSIWKGHSTEDLTPREQDVTELLCQGIAPVNIARELRISLGTTNKHIGHIYKKFGVSSRQELLVRVLGK